MMILVTGQMRFPAGGAAAARALMAEHMAAVAQEEGCELYCFAFDAQDPDLVCIAERWASPEALAQHGQAPHQRAFGRALRDHQVSEVRVKAWDGQFWRTLVGD